MGASHLTIQSCVPATEDEGDEGCRYLSTTHMTDITSIYWAGALTVAALVALLQHHDELLHGIASTTLAEGCHLAGTNCPAMMSWGKSTRQ
jgi:hypothetical protein